MCRKGKGEPRMDINERIAKAQENLEKLEKTLERHTSRYNKLVALKESGKLTKKYLETNNPQYWLMDDIERAADDMARTQKKIDNQSAKIAEMVGKIEKTEKELSKLPPVLKKLQSELEARWNKQDPEHKKENKLEARSYVLDLVRRVKAKVGEITDYDGIRLDSNGYSLNGIVKGTQGSAVLETILAGGYNIQRLHFRTLVK